MLSAFESEKTLIGALLLDASCYVVVKDMLCPTDFFDPYHQQIFDTIRKVYAARGVFDIAMVCDQGEFEPNYLLALANECCSTANIRAHAEIIREKSVQRQLAGVAKDIAEAAAQ